MSSAPLPTQPRTPSGLALNPEPRQHFWFAPPAPRPSIAAERRHRQERLAARATFDTGFALPA